MHRTRISVIIPAFNRGHTLQRALNSVHAQTRCADEIFVVDDGSTDNTAEVLMRYPRVQCIRLENRGVSAARNAGIRAATGDWLAFLDSDDEWRQRKLES
ncbi:MAG: glycosyltransferase family 2 protein [Gammaproteobacteria bacterium]